MKDNSWIVELTDSYYGEKVLFTHFFVLAEINSGFEGIGVQESDFNQLRRAIQEMDSSWFCHETECLSTDQCSLHEGKVMDYSFTLNNEKKFTVPGNELLKPIDEVIDD